MVKNFTAFRKNLHETATKLSARKEKRNEQLDPFKNEKELKQLRDERKFTRIINRKWPRMKRFVLSFFIL